MSGRNGKAAKRREPEKSAEQERKDLTDERLDEALEETFPASDPIAVFRLAQGPKPRAA